MKRLVTIFLLLSFIAVAACSRKEAPQPAMEGKPAPDFTLPDLDGQKTRLSDLKGKVVLVNFWATWCPPCRAEIPEFVETYNACKDKGLVIIGVSLDQVPAQELASFVKNFGMTYPVAFGTEKILDDYQPGQYIPATIIIDKKGMIRSRHVGAMDGDALKSLFLKLSAE